jgi:tetraacyldisaccharide 4'-kinase
MAGKLFKPLISTLWSSGSWVAHHLSATGILPSEKLDSFVISVGNLQAGGAGKTPLIAQIAREALGQGKSVCILSRGYRSEWEKMGGIVPAGKSELDPAKVGDEVALLHDLIPEAWIAVGRDRVAQFKAAEKAHGKKFDVTLLDDGFQHWKIQKDREILVVTSRTREETFFRDFEGQSRRADLLVWSKGDKKPEVLNRLQVPSVKIDYCLNILPTESPYWMVSAIADPEFFRRALEGGGLTIKNELRFSDHDAFEPAAVMRIEKEAAQDGAKIVMTGKDWVKWRSASDGENVLVLEPYLVFQSVQDREVWGKILWG